MRACNSGGTKNPSFRTSTPSNQISPPPHGLLDVGVHPKGELADVPRPLVRREDGVDLLLGGAVSAGGEPKSASGKRTINLPAFAVRALKEHHIRQKQEARWGGLKWHETGHVFTTKVGTPMHHSGLIRQFKKLLKAAKLRDQRFHDLRHCCATLLLAQGVPARVVMAILGHSQISLTLDTYSHVIPALRDEAAGRKDVLLGGTH